VLSFISTVQVVAQRAKMKSCWFMLATFVIFVAVWLKMPAKRQFSLEGSCVIVTGGSYGIGPVIAEEMARQSAGRLVLVARSREKLDNQANVLRKKFPGAEIEVVSTDFGDSEATERAIANATALGCPGAWVLINNAALAQVRAFIDYELEDVDSMFRVNVITPLRITQHMLRLMQRDAKGHVVFVSSLQAMYSHPYMSVYAASKAAITNFAKSLRGELFHAGWSNITVNTVNVGPIIEAGAYDAMNLTIHKWYGSSTPKQVAVAIRDVIEQNLGSVMVNSIPFLPVAVVDLLLSGRSWEVQARIPGTPALPVLEQYYHYARQNSATSVPAK